MAQGYVRKLLNKSSRLRVLQNMPILCGDSGKSWLADKHKGPAHAHTLDYKHLAKADRIHYFDMRPKQYAMARPYLQLEIEEAQVSTKFMSKGANKTLRPIFYLPYQKNNTTRMKLSEPDTYHGDAVEFFATATIDGCSVYVEGDRATPKVTHANAAMVSPTLITDTYAQKVPKIGAKIQAMNQRYGHLDKGVGSARVVERPGYITEDTPGILAIKTRFANAFGVPVAQVTDYQPFGAVIGFKDRGGWRFYLQVNGNFTYHPPGGPAHGKSTYWVISAREFWPGGAGVARTIR